MMPVTSESRKVELHVCAHIIKAELVVRAVGDICGVGRLSLEVVHVVLYAADFKAEEAMNLSHPFGVARGQIVVDRDNVDAAATRQSVEVSGQGCDESFTFTCSHLSDLALMKDEATD